MGRDSSRVASSSFDKLRMKATVAVEPHGELVEP
jgi:hypothetical protein